MGLTFPTFIQFDEDDETMSLISVSFLMDEPVERYLELWLIKQFYDQFLVCVFLFVLKIACMLHVMTL